MRIRRARIEAEAPPMIPPPPMEPEWLAFVTGGTEGYMDVFYTHAFCGRWLEGVQHEPHRGWLAFEHSAVKRKATGSEKSLAAMAWKTNQPLPAHFHALTADVARKAWEMGIAKFGPDFFKQKFQEDGIGHQYDNAIQLSLLGEIRYAP